MANGKPKFKINHLIFTSIVPVIICSGISWIMVTNVAAAKNDVSRNVKQINNDIMHVKDMATGLNNYATHGNAKTEQLAESTQVQFEQTDVKINDVNGRADKLQTDLGGLKSRTDTIQTDVSSVRSDLAGVKTDVTNTKTRISVVETGVSSVNSRADTLESTVNTVKANADSLTQQEANTQSTLSTLTSQVNGLSSGITINPALTPGTSGGTIGVDLRSPQSITMALKVVFRPTLETERTASIDTTYAGLKVNPPVALTADLSLKPIYDLYLNSNNKYCIDSIYFITKGVALYPGVESYKTLTFTATGDYEISVIPVFEAPTLSSSGNSVSTW